MIQLSHVYKEYKGGTAALDDVNLTVQKGEFVFMTGPSGAGKTTLLKLLTCEERASSGQVRVMGKDLSQLRNSSIPYLRRTIGCIFQNFRLLQHRTVFENVALPLRIVGISEDKVRTRVQEVLRSVGLGHHEEIYSTELSGGEQQRVAIARALANRPSILLADEPTGNLDEHLGWEIFGLLKQINAYGVTVLVATHQRGVSEKFRRRRISLEKGRIVYDEGVKFG
jgi:cell division transport system ATP-binding protein